VRELRRLLPRRCAKCARRLPASSEFLYPARVFRCWPLLVLSIGLTPSLAWGQARVQSARPVDARAPVVGSPDDISGRENEARESSDPARAVAETALFLPRTVVDLLYITTGAASGLLDDEQIVPRLKDTFYTEHHEVGLFPTAFVETGFAPNIGARMIASVENFASTLRAGYGGPDTTVVESRLRLTGSHPTPTVLSLEYLQDRRTNLGYVGLGPDPELDPRNHFRAGTPYRSGAYREVRQRAILSLGFRAAPDLEIIMSNGFKARRVDDAPGAGAEGLSDVFEDAAIPGVGQTTRMTYTEVATRVDTRVSRGPPATGAMVEAYGGLHKGVHLRDADAVGIGARWAAYIPVYRVTNIISPRIAIDSILPLGEVPLPFNDYVSAGDFRGFDSRRDKVAMVASLDYRWTLMKFVAARVFGDATNVAPELESLGLDKMRYAWGFGFDLHSATAQLGRVAAAFSEGDVRLFFSLGVAPSGFGDRQHR
jgi:hypothetical protein